jgi:hypothetical protein
VICALQPAEALLAEYERRQRLLDPAYTEARTGLGAELLLAADQFVIRPTGCPSCSTSSSTIYMARTSAFG